MASIRAEAVAEVLWELKRLEKLGTFSEVAERAGFKAGVGGKNLLTCLETIRKEWPHLQWWRAIADNGQVMADSPQAAQLLEHGYEVATVAGAKALVEIVSLESHVISWRALTEEPASATA